MIFTTGETGTLSQDSDFFVWLWWKRTKYTCQCDFGCLFLTVCKWETTNQKSSVVLKQSLWEFVSTLPHVWENTTPPAKKLFTYDVFKCTYSLLQLTFPYIFLFHIFGLPYFCHNPHPSFVGSKSHPVPRRLNIVVPNGIAQPLPGNNSKVVWEQKTEKGLRIKFMGLAYLWLFVLKSWKPRIEKQLHAPTLHSARWLLFIRMQRNIYELW